MNPLGMDNPLIFRHVLQTFPNQLFHAKYYESGLNEHVNQHLAAEMAGNVTFLSNSRRFYAGSPMTAFLPKAEESPNLAEG